MAAIFLCPFAINRFLVPLWIKKKIHKVMKTELHEELLKMAKSFLHDLSNEDFLGLTCDIVKLIGGLVRLVRNESASRNINPTANTARTFYRSPRHIRRLLEEN